ncbi:3'-phosphoadenosine 5'-phosphosulfate sulfotransferase [Mycoemilia scoparia]|uniref:FAD synthase n=1 Tax=Mycoemilia scoparia TaxID=417184 RepID=A0A9W8DRZ8_9FUNG|nr:3'-phosphoadenosine 5'-phosphosulfate sulfotransferase [Mycoemilia scoparia]
MDIAMNVKALSLKEDPLADKVRVSMQVIKKALDTYGRDGLALSFNGGKDCTVLLHLFSAVLRDRDNNEPNVHINGATNSIKKDKSEADHRIRCLYVSNHEVFPEVDAFVAECTDKYNLDLVAIHMPMKEALEEYMKIRKDVGAFLIGTRRGDPHGKYLDHFTPSDHGWPKLMRVSPILDWTYEDIWQFIRAVGIPYCGLYDKGYTSLGNISTTTPNPALLKNGEYVPAYHLKDEELERHGRK